MIACHSDWTMCLSALQHSPSTSTAASGDEKLAAIVVHAGLIVSRGAVAEYWRQRLATSESRRRMDYGTKSTRLPSPPNGTRISVYFPRFPMRSLSSLSEACEVNGAQSCATLSFPTVASPSLVSIIHPTIIPIPFGLIRVRIDQKLMPKSLRHRVWLADRLQLR